MALAGLSIAVPSEHIPRHGLGPLYQEGNSCTGRIVHAMRISEVNHGRDCPELSGLHNYWLSRWLWGGTGRDGGSTIRDAAKAAIKYGAAPAEAWPESMWKVQTRPSPKSQRLAHKLSGVRGYYRLNPLDHAETKQVIASGHAIFGGWYVDRAFLESDGPRRVTAITGPALSLGHAMTIDGFFEDGDYHLVSSWRGWRGTEFSESAVRASPAFVAQSVDLWAIIVH